MTCASSKCVYTENISESAKKATGRYLGKYIHNRVVSGNVERRESASGNIQSGLRFNKTIEWPQKNIRDM